MNRSKRFDVLIVGAGIGGCTAAALFARQGFKVAILERHATPTYKRLCTHFIQSSATATIHRLGLSEPLEAAGAIPNSIDLYTRWGWIRDTDPDPLIRPPHGYNVRRETLDPMLRELAVRSGAELLTGLRVHNLLKEDGRIVGVEATARDDQTVPFRARLVVGADGRSSTVARLANVKTTVKPNNRFAYFAHYQNLRTHAYPNSQMWFLEPDMAYAFPNDGNITVLACMPRKEKLPAWKQDLEGSFIRFFTKLPEGPPIASGERVSDIIGAVELPNTISTAACPGLALVGDAALAGDPLMGIGCGWALESAQWLVECTADALTADRGLDKALKRYAKLHRSRLGGHEFLISDYSTGRNFNPIERLMYSAAARDPAMATHFFDFCSRNIGAMKFLAPDKLLKAARVNLAYRKPAAVALS